VHKIVLLGDKYNTEDKYDFTPLDEVFKIDDLVTPLELTKAMYESNKILNNE
jgi:hypothetical protein